MNRKRKHGLLYRLAAGIIKIILGVILTAVLLVASINLYMVVSASDELCDGAEAADTLQDADCIMVLGASVYGTTPSPMLRDRLDTAIALYRDGVSDMILMSGDHSTQYYNEVRAMQLYAEAAGVPSEAISVDPMGLCTYDSIERVAEEFASKKIVIVTQKYHLYRALYIARTLGLDAYGVSPQDVEYSGQDSREFREIAARCKDFVLTLVRRYPGLIPDVMIGKLKSLSMRY